MAEVITHPQTPVAQRSRQQNVEGATAIREALKAGATHDLMRVLQSLDARAMARALSEAGFTVSNVGTRSEMFDQVKSDLAMALAIRGDGYDLITHRELSVPNESAATRIREAKPGRLTSGELRGDARSVQGIQEVFMSERVSVSLLGELPHVQRDALLMLAGQAMQRGLLGFGFDGIDGKYQLPLRMEQVVELHSAAAAAVAIEEAGRGLAEWAEEKHRRDMSDWLPDSVQRLLSGPVSLDAAEAVIHTIETGSIARHASEKGQHTIESLLVERGLDVHAPTVERQASDLGLEIKEPDRERGRYFGTVVGQDHRALIIRNTRNTGIVIPHSELPRDASKPGLGTPVRVSFQSGAINVVWDNREKTAPLAR